MTLLVDFARKLNQLSTPYKIASIKTWLFVIPPKITGVQRRSQLKMVQSNSLAVQDFSTPTKGASLPRKPSPPSL